MESGFQNGEAFAIAMDARDPLAHFRDRFYCPKTATGEDCLYLCGHSLGLQPKTAEEYIERELREWARLGVEGHFRAKDPWMPYHRLLTQQTAALVGAEPAEVVVMNSLTVNLHLMMASFYRPTKPETQNPGRARCVSFGSICGEVANPFSRISCGVFAARTYAPPWRVLYAR